MIEKIDIGWGNVQWQVSPRNAFKGKQLRQVHGNNIVTYEGADKEADGWIIGGISDQGQYAVRGSDCLTAWIVDAKKTIAVGFHAGWKGMIGNMPAHAMERFCMDGGSNARIYIGPHIQPCCLELPDDLLNQFLAKSIVKHEKSKIYIDMLNETLEQIKKIKIVEYMMVDLRCTKCSLDNLPSYRREGSDRTSEILGIFTVKSD